MIRILDFPRLQIVILSLITTILLLHYFGVRRLATTIFTFIVAVVFLYQAGFVIRYTPLYPVEVHEASNVSEKISFTIIQSTIMMDNRQAGKFKEMIRAETPDIVSINEVDEWWVRKIDVFKKTFPYSLEKPPPNAYGMIILFK